MKKIFLLIILTLAAFGVYGQRHVWRSVSAGDATTYALRDDGTLWTCGWNEKGQLGDGSTETRYEPIKIMDGVQSVSLGCEHTIAIKTDGSLWACGLNCYGELGDGTTTNSLTPVRVLFSGYSEIESIIDNNPISADTEETLYYDLNGIQRQQLKKGLNIVRTKGSKVKKILIK